MTADWTKMLTGTTLSVSLSVSSASWLGFWPVTKTETEI